MALSLYKHRHSRKAVEQSWYALTASLGRSQGGFTAKIYAVIIDAQTKPASGGP